MSGTAIKELPSSIQHLTSLTSLTLLNCYKLECLPNTTCGVKLRGALNLSTCSGFKNLPEKLWMLKDLEMLDLSSTTIKELPSSIELLEDLKMLDLSSIAIEVLPLSIERLTNLIILNLRHCMNFVGLPNTICNLTLLKTLDLYGCLKFETCQRT